MIPSRDILSRFGFEADQAVTMLRIASQTTFEASMTEHQALLLIAAVLLGGYCDQAKTLLIMQQMNTLDLASMDRVIFVVADRTYFGINGTDVWNIETGNRCGPSASTVESHAIDATEALQRLRTPTAPA